MLDCVKFKDLGQVTSDEENQGGEKKSRYNKYEHTMGNNIKSNIKRKQRTNNIPRLMGDCHLFVIKHSNAACSVSV